MSVERKDEAMKIKSSIFDEIEFDEKDIIVLEHGLIGLSNLRRFVLMDFEDETAFHWFQSVDEPDMGFVVSEPTLFDGEYTFAIDRKIKEELEIGTGDDIVVMSIVTIKDKDSAITGNLLGPIVVNATRHRGAQIALNPEDYSTATPLRQPDLEAISNKTEVGCTA